MSRILKPFGQRLRYVAKLEFLVPVWRNRALGVMRLTSIFLLNELYLRNRGPMLQDEAYEELRVCRRYHRSGAERHQEPALGFGDRFRNAFNVSYFGSTFSFLAKMAVTA